MARWEPDARQRLVVAALDLFTEQGYDDTTVAQIADRAGLTKSTFFRHFPDKREVLVAGQDTLSRLLTEGIAAAPESATPLEAVALGLDAAATAFTPERRQLAPRLQAVIAANGELQERDALKHVGLAKAISDALGQRGVADPTASLAAELGVLALRRASARWTDPANDRPLGDLARQSLRELRAASAALGLRQVRRADQTRFIERTVTGSIQLGILSMGEPARSRQRHQLSISSDHPVHPSISSDQKIPTFRAEKKWSKQIGRRKSGQN